MYHTFNIFFFTVSEWLLFSANLAIIELYHVMNIISVFSPKKKLVSSNLSRDYKLMPFDWITLSFACDVGQQRQIMKAWLIHHERYLINQWYGGGDSTLNIFYCSIINNWIGHKFHNLETSSPRGDSSIIRIQRILCVNIVFNDVHFLYRFSKVMLNKNHMAEISLICTHHLLKGRGINLFYKSKF